MAHRTNTQELIREFKAIAESFRDSPGSDASSLQPALGSVQVILRQGMLGEEAQRNVEFFEGLFEQTIKVHELVGLSTEDMSDRLFSSEMSRQTNYANNDSAGRQSLIRQAFQEAHIAPTSQVLDEFLKYLTFELLEATNQQADERIDTLIEYLFLLNDDLSSTQHGAFDALLIFQDHKSLPSVSNPGLDTQLYKLDAQEDLPIGASPVDQILKRFR